MLYKCALIIVAISNIGFGIYNFLSRCGEKRLKVVCALASAHPVFSGDSVFLAFKWAMARPWQG